MIVVHEGHAQCNLLNVPQIASTRGVTSAEAWCSEEPHGHVGSHLEGLSMLSCYTT